MERQNMFIVLTVGEDKVRVNVNNIVSYKEYADASTKQTMSAVKLFGADHLYVRETAQDIDDLLRESYVFIKTKK
jgi:hypothetical protein